MVQLDITRRTDTAVQVGIEELSPITRDELLNGDLTARQAAVEGFNTPAVMFAARLLQEAYLRQNGLVSIGIVYVGDTNAVNVKNANDYLRLMHADLTAPDRVALNRSSRENLRQILFLKKEKHVLETTLTPTVRFLDSKVFQAGPPGGTGKSADINIVLAEHQKRLDEVAQELIWHMSTKQTKNSIDYIGLGSEIIHRYIDFEVKRRIRLQSLIRIVTVPRDDNIAYLIPWFEHLYHCQDPRILYLIDDAAKFGEIRESDMAKVRFINALFSAKTPKGVDIPDPNNVITSLKRRGRFVELEEKPVNIQVQIKQTDTRVRQEWSLFGMNLSRKPVSEHTDIQYLVDREQAMRSFLDTLETLAQREEVDGHHSIYCVWLPLNSTFPSEFVRKARGIIGNGTTILPVLMANSALDTHSAIRGTIQGYVTRAYSYDEVPPSIARVLGLDSTEAGIPDSAFEKWNQRESVISENIKKLARYLGCEKEDLFTA